MDDQNNNNNNNNNKNNTIKYVLLSTTIGDIVIELFFDKTPKTCLKFIELCKSDRYQDTIFHRIIKKFFVQLGRYSVLDNPISNNGGNNGGSNSSNLQSTTPTPLKSYSTILFNNNQQFQDTDYQLLQDDDSFIIKDNKREIVDIASQVNSGGGGGNIDDSIDTLLKETLDAKLKFSTKGLVCLGNYNQILITLDHCDALNRKYPIFGKIHSSTTNNIYQLLETTPVDINNSPLTPIILTNIKYFENLPETNQNDHQTPTTPSSVISTPSNNNINNNNKRLLELDPIQLQSPFIKKMKTQVNLGHLSQISPSPSPRLLSNISGIDQRSLSTLPLLSSPLMTPSQPQTQQIRPKWPNKLVIIRHAQSEQNAALDLYQDDIDRLVGVRDASIKLTEVGEWQALKTGEYLSNTYKEKFDIVFVSPYHRALETARIMLSQLSYQPKVYKDNWLREKEFGLLHGYNKEMILKKFPDAYAMRERDGGYWFRPPNGENYPDVELRVHAFLEKISRSYSGKNILIVTHQVPYKVFNALFHHLDEESVLKLEPVYNCGIQEYILDTSKTPEGRMKLRHFNFKAFNIQDLPENLSGNRNSREKIK